MIRPKSPRSNRQCHSFRTPLSSAGLEALDARRRLFEEAENGGDLKFDDPGVRHLFYYYANMRHTVVDEKALEEPWFLSKRE